MTAPKVALREHGNAYNIFILVMTVYSLGLMALSVLPWFSEGTKQLAGVYDNLICLVFLADFFYNLTGAKPKRGYFFGQLGWIDLLGSIPTFGIVPAAALFRLFRLFRLLRIVRILRKQDQKQIFADIIRNRSQYAFYITVMLVVLVLSTGSILVLQFESGNPDANITSGGNALWWSIVTITTVGYGDFYPITPFGRITAVFIMFAGIGVIGALASLLASVLVGGGDAAPAEEGSGSDSTVPADGDAAPAPPSPAPGGPAPTPPADASMAAISAELASIRAELAALRDDLAGRPG